MYLKIYFNRSNAHTESLNDVVQTVISVPTTWAPIAVFA